MYSLHSLNYGVSKLVFFLSFLKCQTQKKWIVNQMDIHSDFKISLSKTRLHSLTVVKTLEFAHGREHLVCNRSGITIQCITLLILTAPDKKINNVDKKVLSQV